VFVAVGGSVMMGANSISDPKKLGFVFVGLRLMWAAIRGRIFADPDGHDIGADCAG